MWCVEIIVEGVGGRDHVVHAWSAGDRSDVAVALAKRLVEYGAVDLDHVRVALREDESCSVR